MLIAVSGPGAVNPTYLHVGQRKRSWSTARRPSGAHAQQLAYLHLLLVQIDSGGSWPRSPPADLSSQCSLPARGLESSPSLRGPMHLPCHSSRDSVLGPLLVCELVRVERMLHRCSLSWWALVSIRSGSIPPDQLHAAGERLLGL
jgi:hypothetical protein